MYAKTYGETVCGINGEEITVEVDISNGPRKRMAKLFVVLTAKKLPLRWIFPTACRALT